MQKLVNRIISIPSNNKKILEFITYIYIEKLVIEAGEGNSQQGKWQIQKTNGVKK